MSTDRPSPPPPPPQFVDADELPTIRLLPSRVPSALRDIEVTSDALPDELLAKALPFVPAPEPDDVETTYVAKLAAQMVVDKTRTLAREGLSPDAWAKIEQRCAILLAAAIENDRAEMRDAYDAAFLEARAAHRGHFGREAHAELRDELLGGKVVETDLVLDVADAIRVRRLNNRSA